MKKILALTLAAVMAAGMTTVAFAKNEETPYIENAGGDTVMYVLEDGEAKSENIVGNDGYVEGGAEIAIPVSLDKSAWYTIDSDFDKKLVVDEDWYVNEADTEFRFVKYAADCGLDGAKAVRIYSLVITVPENDSDKVMDLMGSVADGFCSCRQDQK